MKREPDRREQRLALKLTNAINGALEALILHTDKETAAKLLMCAAHLARISDKQLKAAIKWRNGHDSKRD